jgi:outer membrane protein assembly factor BamA
VAYILKISDINKRKRINIFYSCIAIQALIFVGALFLQNSGYAQSQTKYYTSLEDIPFDSISIDRIFVIGNKRTKERIIRRELDFTDGDRIPTQDLKDRIKKNEEKLTNTSLFMTVKISLVEISHDRVDVIIRLVERWYIFPIPVLELADRNFKDWWVNQNHDFSRIEWGLKLYLYNMRGRNETLRLQGQLGFTKRFKISYEFPYIDKKQRFGLGFMFDYKQNKNTFYRTVDNVLVFLDSDHWLKEQYIGDVSTTYRKGFYSLHKFGASYYNTDVNDTIVELNPNYFGEGGKTKQRFFSLYYSFVNDKRDIAAYPLHGSYFVASISKNGLGVWDDINNIQLSALYYKYIDIGKHFYLSGNVGGQLLTPSDQPYNVYNRMGIGRFTLRGYELYVIEGPLFVQNQWTFRKLLFKIDKNLSSAIPIRQLSQFYLALYAKTYFDLGYIEGYPNNELNKRLTDQLLYSGGLGLDLVTIYDIVLRFEYTFNKQGESGFVFGFRAVF